MSDFLLVQNEQGLVRDRHNKALLATDLKAKEAFMKEREQVMSIGCMQNDLATIKSDLLEIKDMLKSISKIKCSLQQPK
jgi:hypothetical protein